VPNDQADVWLTIPEARDYAATKGVPASDEYWRERVRAGDVEAIQPTERKRRISRASIDRFIDRSRTGVSA
jgi:hypothetical protein